MLLTSTPAIPNIKLDLQALQGLLTPDDLVLLIILGLFAFYGAKRGLMRTLLGLLSGVVSLVGAGFLARLASPHFARFVVMPIVGSVFKDKAAAVLQSTAHAPDSGASLFGPLADILNTPLVKNAAEPLRVAAEQTAQTMAESLSFVLLLAIFTFVLTMVFQIMGSTAKMLTRIKVIGTTDALLGGACGVTAGLALILLVFFALDRFAPAVFTPLGALSPSSMEQTLLTRTLYGIVSRIR